MPLAIHASGEKHCMVRILGRGLPRALAHTSWGSSCPQIDCVLGSSAQQHVQQHVCDTVVTTTHKRDRDKRTSWCCCALGRVRVGHRVALAAARDAAPQGTAGARSLSARSASGTARAPPVVSRGTQTAPASASSHTPAERARVDQGRDSHVRRARTPTRAAASQWG